MVGFCVQRTMSYSRHGVTTLILIGLTVTVGCGGSSTTQSSSTKAATPATPSVTRSSGTAVSAHPGCGTYCQEAGVPAGDAPPGYPCPSTGCFRCPPTHCATLLSASATARAGAFSVKLRCRLETPCQGAFLLCFHDTSCSRGPTHFGVGGRLAASDFTLDADRTTDVPVELTALGEKLASLSSGFPADVIVDLRNYGLVSVGSGQETVPGGTLRIRTADSGYTPPGGAVAACGSGLLIGGHTSCGFARAVIDAYVRAVRSQSDIDVRASSPATHLTYTMRCVGISPHVCTGGLGARVMFY